MADPNGTQRRGAESSQYSIAILDGQGTITAWSKGASSLLGYTLDEVLNRNVKELLAAGLPAQVRRACARGDAWSARVPVRQRSGEEIHLSVQAYALTGARRHTRWLLRVASYADGGTPARGDAAPTVLKEWAWDQLAIPVAVCDVQARVVAVNREMSRVTGRSEEELLGGSVDDLVPGGPPGTPNGLPQLAEQVYRTGETMRHTVQTRPEPDAEERLWSVVLSPLSEAGDEVRALCLAFVDMTQQGRARHRLAIVNEAGDRVGRSLDVTQTAQELADVGVEFADFVTVDLLDAVLGGENLEPSLPVGKPLLFRRVAQQSVLDDCPESVIPLGEAHAHSEDSPPGRALRSGEAYSHGMSAPEVRSWLEQLPARRESARRYGIHAVTGVPLVARGTTLGIVQFFRHLTPQPFDGDDVLLAQEIAARASVCVDNARRYMREHTTALTLQQDLLPRMARDHPAVEVASRYLPAKAGVGGDWYDVIPLSGARVALVIGDVVGHGVAAAATMGRLSTAVRTLAGMELAPDELLTHLDDLIISMSREGEPAGNGMSGPVGHGATCLYAIYDPVTATLDAARSGHPPPALVTPEGVVDFPELPQAPPLGVGGLPFETYRTQVPDGSLLAFYTNGLLGGAGADIDAGLSRLRDTLHRHTGSLEKTCDSVVATVLQGRHADDIALLLARTRLLDADQVAEWEVAAEPAAVGELRRKVSRQLSLWALEELDFTTELIASELLTNALRYGSEPLRLRLIREASLTCEVADSGSAVPHIRRARQLDEGGRGLMVVAQIADRWGSRHTTDGKIIWAEQFLQDETASP